MDLQWDQLLMPLSTWLDVLDVVLVTAVLYNLLLLIRGTRAVQILVGLLVLVVFYTSARAFGLVALELTLRSFFIILPVAVLVLFQHEIRRALARFGRTPIFSMGNHQSATSAFDDLVLAATTLSERRIGALIVIERHEGLRYYIENGIALDAMISVDLLISLFITSSPTHDGAVIIRDDRVAAATCFLPLSRHSELSKELGTRHRAALGISEETDAVAIVVSEETGTISLAFGGNLSRRLESNDLRNQLFRHLLSHSDPVDVIAS